LRTLARPDEFRAVSALDAAELDARRARSAAERAKEAQDAIRKRLARSQQRLEQASKHSADSAAALDRDRETALAAAREAMLECSTGRWPRHCTTATLRPPGMR